MFKIGICLLTLISLVKIGINGESMVPGCHDFKTGVTRKDKQPMNFTLYGQAYRDLSGLTDKSQIQCDRMNATYDVKREQLNGQSIYMNTTTGVLHRGNFAIHLERSGVYTVGKSRDSTQCTQVYTVLKVTPYGIFLYSCAPKLGFNLIRFQTYVENPKTIPWDEVGQQFRSFGFPGYHIIDQKPNDCKKLYSG